SFVGTLALVVVATVATQLLAAGIHEDAFSIANNSAPSMATLGEARTGLRHLEVLIDDWVEHRLAGRENASEVRAVEVTRQRLNSAWKEYVALPSYPGELAMRGPVSRDLEKLLAAIESAMRTAPPQAETALDQVKLAAEQLDQSLLRLVAF